jgi:5,6-dimethylbenzimidazole synthase
VQPVAYLCLGHVSEFLPQPELEIAGWRSRLPLEQLLHANTWDNAVKDEALLGAVRKPFDAI